MDDQTKGINGLQIFSPLIGKWKTEGMVAGNGKEPPHNIEGTDEYEWVLGGSFILHRVNVFMGDQKTEALELIGKKEGSSQFIARAFDNSGDFSEMTASAEPEDIFKFSGPAARSIVKVSATHWHMEAHWERFEGKKWKHWMDLTFTKEKIEAAI